MLRVVVDTNIFVSSVISKTGSPALILQAWRNHDFLLIMSDEMVEEIERVFQYSRIKDKYNFDNSLMKQIIDTIRKHAVVIPDTIKLDVIKEDPDDNKILACAIDAEADYIVSGDKHLLSLGIYKNIPIMTVKEFLSVL